jgi:putative membrane protein
LSIWSDRSGPVAIMLDQTLKALHIVAVISWMAGLLYLPRLFVYHCAAQRGSELSETFKVMERRLFRAIMTPAMIASWLLGLAIAWRSGWFAAGWFHAKLVLVAVLSGFHDFLGRKLKDFAADSNEKPAGYYRVVNEIPTLLMIGIVFLVVLKPF